MRGPNGVVIPEPPAVAAHPDSRLRRPRHRRREAYRLPGLQRRHRLPEEARRQLHLRRHDPEVHEVGVAVPGRHQRRRLLSDAGRRRHPRVPADLAICRTTSSISRRDSDAVGSTALQGRDRSGDGAHHPRQTEDPRSAPDALGVPVLRPERSLVPALWRRAGAADRLHPGARRRRQRPIARHPR